MYNAISAHSAIYVRIRQYYEIENTLHPFGTIHEGPLVTN